MKAMLENIINFVEQQDTVVWEANNELWEAEFRTYEGHVFATLHNEGEFYNYFEVENGSFFIGEDECEVEVQWADIYYEFIQLFKKEFGYVA